MTDTQPDIYIKQLEIFLLMPVAKRFQVCEDLMIFGRKIIESAIIQENNNLTDIDLKIEVFRRCYANQFSAEELKRITEAMKRYFQQL